MTILIAYAIVIANLAMGLTIKVKMIRAKQTAEQEMMISPQEIVKRYNISYQTLNYYTNIGLLEVKRRRGNGRLYNEQELERDLERITELKDQGYPLRLIGKML